MARLDRSKEELWRRMIARQAKSGLSVRAWCGRHDVSEASFYWWRRRLAGRGGARPTTTRRARPGRTGTPAFVPVRIAADRVATPAGSADREGVPAPNADRAGAASDERRGGIEIILRGERRVRVFGAVDRQALADVLAVLHGSDSRPCTTAAAEVAAC